MLSSFSSVRNKGEQNDYSPKSEKEKSMAGKKTSMKTVEHSLTPRWLGLEEAKQIKWCFWTLPGNQQRQGSAAVAGYMSDSSETL